MIQIEQTKLSKKQKAILYALAERSGRAKSLTLRDIVYDGASRNVRIEATRASSLSRALKRLAMRHLVRVKYGGLVELTPAGAVVVGELENARTEENE